MIHFTLTVLSCLFWLVVGLCVLGHFLNAVGDSSAPGDSLPYTNSRPVSPRLPMYVRDDSDLVPWYDQPARDWSPPK